VTKSLEVGLYDRIIVPLDGSDLAEAALPTAIALAAVLKTPVVLMRIADFSKLERYSPYGVALEYEAFDSLISRDEHDAETYLAIILDRYPDSGVPISIEIRRGMVAREIVEFAGSRDLIVIASHGRSGITRWLLGSVAEDIVRNGKSPVLLVRAEAPGDVGESPKS